MNTEKAIKLLREMQEAWKLQITGDAYDALEMAITALDQLDNNSTKPNNSTATQSNGIKDHVKGMTTCRVPEGDTISRADVEQTVEDNILCYTHTDRPIDQDPDTECHMAIRTALRMLRKDLRKLPSVQPEKLTDKEQRIFLSAMGREEEVCKEVDDAWRDFSEPYEDSLVHVCKEIRRKVKGALWT